LSSRRVIQSEPWSQPPTILHPAYTALEKIQINNNNIEYINTWSGYIGYTSTQQQWFLRCLGNRKVGVGLYTALPRAYSCASSGEKLFIPSWWDRLVTPFSWSSSTTRSSLYIPIYTSCNHRQKWAPPFGSWVGVLCCSTRTSHSRKGRRGLINNCGSTAPLSKTSFGTKRSGKRGSMFYPMTVFDMCSAAIALREIQLKIQFL